MLTLQIVKYVVCGGKCPGCMDASFYEPRDRYADRKRDKPEFKDFKIKIPPIGATYEEFDDDLDDKSYRPLPCRLDGVYRLVTSKATL